MPARLIKLKGKRTAFSWTVAIGFIVIFAAIFFSISRYIDSLIGIGIIAFFSGVLSYLLFNKPTDESLLIIKQWITHTDLSPHHEDKNAFSNLNEIPNLKKILQEIKKQ